MAVDALTKKYARAIFLEASEVAEEAIVYGELAAVAYAIVSDAEFRVLLKNPGLPDAEKTRLLVRIARPDGEASDCFARFAALVIEKQRSDIFAGCAEAFLQLWDEHRGIVRALVKSASTLNEEQQHELEMAVKAFSSAEVILEFEVDTSLVAGVTVQMGDRLLDGSVRGKLKVLSERLRKH